ncbi:hypothetical protein BOX15_Mlig019353g2 [Macrostomum lignano]|uniref:Fibrinogen C-terminal domain-containing protein n=1 Tax=Macrostomum lignano TaxID=282301 RepID=A0A267E8M5_9PLAT|nr:hypothetical protein BOX15_Mlig019353g2 [Macrostomum lignano]
MQLQTALHLTIWLCLGIGVSAKIKVNFLNQPADIIYNYLSGTFEVTMMAKIGEYVRGEPQSHLKVERLAVKLDSGRDFGVPVTARLSTDGTVAQLVFECRSWRKCLQVREQINLNPAKVQRAIEFTLTGHSDTGFFNLHVRAPESAPAQYAVEFQRNFDRIISFAQNWDTYVKGFGNSDIRLGNYWMGLKRLSSLTKDRSCKLIFEAMKFDGTAQRGIFRDFQVRGEDENFKLRVGDAEPGNPMYMMKNHDNAQFSTFDRDNDKWSADCSGYHGKTGWWYHDGCHNHNPNGIIAEKDFPNKDACYNYCSSWTKQDKRVCWRATRLSFICA